MRDQGSATACFFTGGGSGTIRAEFYLNDLTGEENNNINASLLKFGEVI